MTEFDSIKEGEINRAILVGLNARRLSAEETATEASMEELAALLETAGGTCVGSMLQNRESPDPGSFIGEGKAQELKELVKTLEADLVIFDNALSPTQVRVLTEMVGVQVMDRAGLILDIFAKRAQTREGRLQVELAQYRYILPRLTGMWGHLVRQTASGGKSPIGTRGPGETQLETDRRHIRRKITRLEADLREVRRVRAVQRERREKNEVPVVALVGYTNAGKSTLLNRLTDAGVLAEDKLFATLDPTARALKLPDGREVLLVDTVGFVRRLPHHLVEAFRSTLEEAVEADVILNLCDASSPEAGEHLAVTQDLLTALGCTDRPVLAVFNKCDAAPAETLGALPAGALRISARTGEGLEALLEAVAAALPPDRRRVRLLLPFSQGGLAQRCRLEGAVESETYVPEGLDMTVTLGTRLLESVREYIVEQEVQADPAKNQAEKQLERRQ